MILDGIFIKALPSSQAIYSQFSPRTSQALQPGAILSYANQDHSGLPVIDGYRTLDAIKMDLMNGWTISHYSEQEGLAPSAFHWSALSEISFTNDWRNGQYAVVNWAGQRLAKRCQPNSMDLG